MKVILLVFIIMNTLIIGNDPCAKGFDIDSMKKGKSKLLNKNYFISTSLSSKQIKKGLHTKICKKMGRFIRFYNNEAPFITCTSYSKSQKTTMKKAYKKELKNKDTSSPKYKYHYHIDQLSNKKFEFKVTNLDQRDPAVDFKRSAYFIKYESEENLLLEFKKTLYISLEYDKRNLQAKMMFIKATLEAKDSEYELIKSEGENTTIIQHKKSKIKYGIMKYYNLLKNDKDKKNYLRGILEVVAIYGFAGASYIVDSETPEISSGFHYDWGDVFNYSKRVRFDDEGPGFNWGHVLAGMLVHTIFRSNNFTRLESFVATLLVSTAWENFFEFREVWSVNDQFFTIFAGSSMALATEVVCDKFVTSRKKNNILTKALSVLHNPFCTLNNMQDGITRVSGFDKDEMSSVDILSRVSYNKTTGKASLGLEINSDIIDLPIKGAGEIKHLVLDPRIAQVQMMATGTTSGLDELRGFTQVALAAYHLKNMELDEDQILNGYSFVFSLTTGTEFHSRNTDKNEDWFGVANILGTKVEIFYFYRGIKVRMGLNISGDVAMARSYGYNNFISKNGEIAGAPQDILVKTQADFYWGYTTRADIAVSGKINGAFGGTWELGASTANTDVKNFESLQRNSDEMDNLVTLKEGIRKFKVYFAYGPNAFDNLRFQLSYEELYRKGNVFSTLDGLFAKDSNTQRQVMLSVIHNYL